MEIGQHCAFSTCGRLSFLPVACPLCTTTFCESHFLPEQHRCAKAASTSKVLSDDELLQRIAASGSSGRLPCQKQGCKKLSFEVQTQPATASPAQRAATIASSTFTRSTMTRETPSARERQYSLSSGTRAARAAFSKPSYVLT